MMYDKPPQIEPKYIEPEKTTDSKRIMEGMEMVMKDVFGKRFSFTVCPHCNVGMDEVYQKPGYLMCRECGGEFEIMGYKP